MQRVHFNIHGAIAHLRLDDGKVNAINAAWLEQLDAALDQAKDADAVLLSGRPGVFSAGLDLKTLPSLPLDEARSVLHHFCATMLQLFSFPRPLVGAITGHAIAGGAVTLLGADHRVGTEADCRIGLSEVAIALPLPSFVIEMARSSLTTPRLMEALAMGQLYTPQQALGVGYLHQLAPDDEVVPVALAQTQAMAQLPSAAFRLTKQRLRAAAHELGRRSYITELDSFVDAFPRGMGS